MPVNSLHPEYEKMVDKWKLVRDIVNNDAQDHIRTVDPNDPVRSLQYKEDAILTNFTNLTKIGLTGLVFSKPTEYFIPPELDYLEDDTTGERLGLKQFSQYVVEEVLQTGRMGLLVDYPPVNGTITKEMEELLDIKARIKPYIAESIINWQLRDLGSKSVLSLVVLEETVQKINDLDGFQWEEKKQYRILRLSESLIYTQMVLSEDGDIVEPETTPIANGKPFNRIPFVFVGSQNNDWRLDNPPLYDMAVINLGHYRNSADYEESIFIVGQPTIFTSGDQNPDEFNAVYPDGIYFGARKGYHLGVDGRAELLQASPNQLADAAMKRKEEQAAAIGARLIAPPGGRETAEAARIRYGSQNSALFTITDNCSMAIEEALMRVAEFQGANPEPIEFRLNKEFFDETADPNLIAQEILMLEKKAISIEEFRKHLKRVGVLEEGAKEDIPFEVQPQPEVANNNPEDEQNNDNREDRT